PPPAAAAGAAGPGPAAPPAPVAEPDVPQPIARVALAFVGSDPDAEEAWGRAINDPALPPNARKDLIEDLNEEGFTDPGHPTPDDLPLIVNRLALIEELIDGSMDDVNAAAFAEAYKDLARMLVRAGGGN
ncbi:MAG: hypothetical protein JWO31_3383, partial [Phycisphaerales bacterium]|nr:hypothetical protein [Phycisphaerales bacterium]